MKTDFKTIAVDWSGAMVGASKKIWCATARDGDIIDLQNGFSREEIVRFLVSLGTEKVVVGLDFAFSMPEWYVRSSGCDNAPVFWELMKKTGEDLLQECRSPFWGRPGKKCPIEIPPVKRFRKTELNLNGTHPKSVFQIFGAGAVGTGSIRGMPFLSMLRNNGYKIWPFDTFDWPCVIEIYPRIFSGSVVKRRRVECSDYLRKRFPRLSSNLRDKAACCDDAFDAAVSALWMDEHRSSLSKLTKISDQTTLIEGRIWSPS